MTAEMICHGKPLIAEKNGWLLFGTKGDYIITFENPDEKGFYSIVIFGKNTPFFGKNTPITRKDKALNFLERLKPISEEWRRKHSGNIIIVEEQNDLENR